MAEAEIKEGAPFAALSYVFFLWIFSFIFKKDNNFAHFHARQGIVIFIFEIACLFFPIIPFIGVIVYRAGMFILLMVSLYGVYSSLIGKMVKIPVIGNIAEKLVV